MKDKDTPNRTAPRTPELHFSTRHLPRDVYDALHILKGRLEPERKLWQVVNMALRRGIRLLGEDYGVEGLLPPKAKNGNVKRVREGQE